MNQKTVQVRPSGAFWRVRIESGAGEVPFRTEREALAHAIQIARNERPSLVEEVTREGRVRVVANYRR